MTDTTDAVVKEFETQIQIREQTIAAKRNLIEANERMNRDAVVELARSEAVIEALRAAIRLATVAGDDRATQQGGAS